MKLAAWMVMTILNNTRYLRLSIVMGVLLVFSSDVGAVSLRDKLAMSGYSETEINDIVSGQKNRQEVDWKYKRSMLGFSNDRYPNGRFELQRPLPAASKAYGKSGRMDGGLFFVEPRSNPLAAKAMLAAAQPYSRMIKDAANRHDVRYSLILAIILAESGFNPHAVSDKGAVGLMQLMPHTAADLGVTDLFDLRQNIFAGTRYFSDCLRTFNTVELALAAYNAGPSCVAEYRKVPPFKETIDFIKSVLNYEKLYRKLIRAL